jgi:hypothetical protein
MISEDGTAGPWRTLNERSYVYIDAPDATANFGPVTVTASAGRVG